MSRTTCNRRLSLRCQIVESIENQGFVKVFKVRKNPRHTHRYNSAVMEDLALPDVVVNTGTVSLSGSLSWSWQRARAVALIRLPLFLLALDPDPYARPGSPGSPTR